jgi:dethiobiotin synthetase
MSARFIIAGTDTGVGKTVFAAALTRALHGVYFKPIQAGLDSETDTETVKRLTGLSDAHFLPELYRLRTPASPHIAAEIDSIEIDIATLAPSATMQPLVIESAGGLMVPLTRKTLFIDILGRWDVPVILCARTTLGTINHSLLSIEALKARAIPIHGVAFIGDKNNEVEMTIAEMGDVRRLGCLPWIDPLNCEALGNAFQANFWVVDFVGDPPIP